LWLIAVPDLVVYKIKAVGLSQAPLFYCRYQISPAIYANQADNIVGGYVTDQIAAAIGGEIYDVLDQATNHELSPIVKNLVDSPFSYLKYTRAYQRYHPDHSVYRDQIADEICRLGLFLTAGSMAVAGTMTGSRPGYTDLLATVCKKIGIPAAGLAWQEIEAIYINMFVRHHLLTVAPEERPELIDAAAAAAGSALLHIAYLRSVMAECGRLEGVLAGSRAIVRTKRDEPVNSVIVIGDDGAPVLSLAAIPREVTENWTFMKPDGRTLSKLTPFIEALQPLFSAQKSLSGNNIYSSRLPLSYSGKVGGFAGVAKGHQGMMPLQQVTAVGLSGPAVFLTATAAIAQQQQMERIEKALDDIKAMLADVSRFQQVERHSALTGSIRYFRQVARAVLSGELASEVLHTIEQHEAELVKIYEHLVNDLRVATETLRAIKKETFGSAKYVKALQNAQAVVTSLYDDILLCLRARACGFQLMSAYPGRGAGKQARYEAICRDIHPFLPAGEATAALDRVLRDKLQAIASYESKALLLVSESMLFENIRQADSAIITGLAAAISVEAQTDDSLVLDFQVNSGQVVGVRLGSDDPSPHWTLAAV
jgi:hypothetical protein